MISSSRRRVPLFVGSLLIAVCKFSACGSMITFSDQPDSEGPMSPSSYLVDPTGITATFSNFTEYNGTLGEKDHTQDGVDRFIYGSHNSPAGTIIFSSPVDAVSFWVATGSTGGKAGGTITGLLGGTTEFVFTNNQKGSTWVNVTVGANNTIDELVFSKYLDAWVDDISLIPGTMAPEPSANAYAVACFSWYLLRRTIPRRTDCRSRSISNGKTPYLPLPTFM